METYEIIKMINNEIEKAERELVERKQNINKKYDLAKLDFIIIENKTDKISTLKDIKFYLEELQKRIVKRNRGDK